MRIFWGSRYLPQNCQRCLKSFLVGYYVNVIINFHISVAPDFKIIYNAWEFWKLFLALLRIITLIKHSMMCLRMARVFGSCFLENFDLLGFCLWFQVVKYTEEMPIRVLEVKSITVFSLYPHINVLINLAA